ncbi:MAG TPA: polysaccharide deacetylase [Candidatus Dormibacteraeota bacterium]|jgi:peptidoglycan/xylan/chitin deacetylase (PgdA/CDA1 family)|nr:polysaccharide deacetylase [Candidatus Dormibacteraeota bacterium]
MGGTVCLTFDFDAMSLWIARGLRSPGPLSRGEFGVHAIPRLLHLLERRDLPATFFIPGHTVETYPDACRRIVEAGHEVGLHGYVHETVSDLTPEQERDVFWRSHEILSELVGRPPRGNRTPSWDLSPHTVPILLELGVRYDSSLMSTDYTPFYCRTGDEVPTDRAARLGEETDLVEIPVSWSLDDYPAFEYYRSSGFVMPGLRSPAVVFGNWLDDVRYMLRDFDDGVCVLTFHPQVIGRGHRLLGLERFLDQLQDLGVAFDRLDHVAEQFRGGRRYGTYRFAPVKA